MAEGSLSESGNLRILPSLETSWTAVEENQQQRMLYLHLDCIQPAFHTTHLLTATSKHSTQHYTWYIHSYCKTLIGNVCQGHFSYFTCNFNRSKII